MRAAALFGEDVEAMATSPAPVETGRLLGGRYRVGPRLAGGGMAEVFLAQDARLDRDVAIKVLRPDKAADPAIRRRFATEGLAAARLSHPNVVGVYDVGDDGGNPYLVMELVTGGTLAERIRTGPLSADAVRQTGLDILAGLGAAHAAGIMHRDVKPANVLIDDRGSAKLADFGIAKANRPADSEATATAMVIGTPSYLAPERAAGAPASVATDLWAVGVVLYEATVGVRPFQGTTPLAVVLAARSGDMVPLRECRPDIDPALEGAVHRALSPHPADRFPSAAAMAAALQRVGEGGPSPVAVTSADSTVALLPAPTRVPRRPLMKRGARLAVASAVAALALVLAWTITSAGDRSGSHTVPTTAVHAQVPTATVHAQVTTTVAAPTSAPATDSTPTSAAPPTTVSPPPVHAGSGRDHGKGHGNPGNEKQGDGNQGNGGGNN